MKTSSRSRRNFLKTSVASTIAMTTSHRHATAGETATPKNLSTTGFPADFIWGTATAAYQIEGAANIDGRGESIWDVFCRKPGAVFGGNTGDVACDHYHRYREDVALMKQLGVKAYRFSVAWPRVLPQGTGTVNQKGLDFYDRLLDEVLKAGVTPYCTLFHWDLPEAIYQKGGWLHRDIAGWFADYTSVVVGKFKDRIGHWITQNEPQVYIGAGMLDGTHAPGTTLPMPEFLKAAHNSMRAHASSVRAIRALAPQASIGYAMSSHIKHPVTHSEADIAAARKATYGVKDKNSWNNTWWLDPVFKGEYPESGLRLFGTDMPAGYENDLAEMHPPVDFIGMNIYTSAPVRAGKDGEPEEVKWPDGYPRTGVDWQQVVPQALYWGPRFIHERYQLPIFITENGCSTRDQIFLDGKVHDPQRIDIMHRYLLELRRAITDGVPVKGYFEWSLLDNFEWADGYKQRFGIVYVDYPTQKRIPKDSFHWYQEVIRSNGVSLTENFAMPVDQVTVSAL
jgi:beta-glucosidase